MKLQLPDAPVPDRVSIVRRLEPHEKYTYAELEGPGCIRHIFITPGPHPLKNPNRMANRKLILRIYFDDQPIPYVEAPIGDFFGVMHGQGWYPIDNHYLSVKAWKGYNCYFPMPFAKMAQVEIECGDEDNPVYCQVDWHRYPGRELTESRRFCARWRREMPTQRYGEDFLILDADGPGQLLGFVYGVRLLDDADRWSHGGSDNIYVDGEGPHPVYMRGIGGEDTFGEGYGGALHPPETHHYAAMPYYVHEDTGEARVAQRLVGYRFYEPDTILFRKSLHMRFGCMANDICSTVYWYQEGPVRPFFRMPDWPQLLPGVELPRDTCDMPLPASGEWWLCGPFGNQDDQAMRGTLPAEAEIRPEAVYDGMHEDGSRWLTEGSRQLGRDVARWVKRAASHGFIDFNHVFRPYARGAGVTHPGVAIAHCVLDAPSAMTATLRLAWDDRMIARINGEVLDLGWHYAFRAETVPVRLTPGANHIVIKLSNEKGSNHGGWVFAFRATAPDGTVLIPEAPSVGDGSE